MWNNYLFYIQICLLENIITDLPKMSDAAYDCIAEIYSPENAAKKLVGFVENNCIPFQNNLCSLV